MECRLGDLEQYSSIHDVVVSRLEIRLRSYAGAVAAAIPTESDLLFEATGNCVFQQQRYCL